MAVIKRPCKVRISIHAPREGRDVGLAQIFLLDEISIHAPREGRDSSRKCRIGRSARFQSTRPVRGATPVQLAIFAFFEISIHAPREGRDEIAVGIIFEERNFNPRAP